MFIDYWDKNNYIKPWRPFLIISSVAYQTKIQTAVQLVTEQLVTHFLPKLNLLYTIQTDGFCKRCSFEFDMKYTSMIKPDSVSKYSKFWKVKGVYY